MFAAKRTRKLGLDARRLPRVIARPTIRKWKEMATGVAVTDGREHFPLVGSGERGPAKKGEMEKKTGESEGTGPLKAKCVEVFSRIVIARPSIVPNDRWLLIG